MFSSFQEFVSLNSMNAFLRPLNVFMRPIDKYCVIWEFVQSRGCFALFGSFPSCYGLFLEEPPSLKTDSPGSLALAY